MIEHNTLIYDMSNDDYHAHQAISSSNCKDLLKSPWSYQHKRENPASQTPSMAFGSLVHALVLEPSTFESRYFIADKPKRNTKDGKAKYAELLQECATRAWVSRDDYLKASDMTCSLLASNIANLLLKGGSSEVATFWQDRETGIECRAKCDHINLDAAYIVDLKTTSSLANEKGFKSTLLKYQYHLSAAMYLEGFSQAIGSKLDFLFIVIESAPPYNFGVYKLGVDLLTQGSGLYRDALAVYKRALDKGTFKVPYNDGLLLELVA